MLLAKLATLRLRCSTHSAGLRRTTPPAWSRRVPCPLSLERIALAATMAAAAAASAAASVDDASSTCFICLEPHSGPGPSQRLLRGCACRGGSGFGHMACVAKAAQETNDSMWHSCPTCKQHWTGQMELGLAHARVASLTSLPEE